MNDDRITIKDYTEVGEEFFDKYYYVARELGEDPKPADILRVMDSLNALVLKSRETKPTPVGFATLEAQADDPCGVGK